jgi:glutathionyl-hydroquinone reductase
LFTTLDEIEKYLATNRYLCGDNLTLADVRLFTTLIRFDLVYYGLFKCSVRRIQDYQYLSEYLKALYQLPGIATTCDLDAIKQDYYGNLFPLNPGGIIPLNSQLNYLQQPLGVGSSATGRAGGFPSVGNCRKKGVTRQ